MTTISAYIKARRKKEAAQTFIINAKLIKICKCAYENYFNRQKFLKARYKLLFYLRIQMSSYLKHSKKKGPTYLDRNRRIIRSSINFTGILYNDVVKKRAQQKILKPFIS